GDDYSAIMVKLLADRMAEAFSELLHRELRRQYWGYAPDEQLAPEDLFAGHYTGIRPAHGYPACPDHSEKETLFDLLDAPAYGMKLTESYAIYPTASTCGLVFAHPQSRYFAVGKITAEQLNDYALRKGMLPEQIKKFLA
ncbi:MAG: hypothetical protein LBV39_03250, partial [Bacteroidales bacterium]|nr:hypothetical protein [Bacteroidales bacterium]